MRNDQPPTSDLLVDDLADVGIVIHELYPCGACGAEWASATAAQYCCRD